MRDTSLLVPLQNPRTVLLIIWVVSALYLGSHANRDWVPIDDGALGHSAERVLDGELPHRDFDAIYTGGQSLLHAFAFRALGINILSMRILLLVFALTWVPAVYAIAGRGATPWVAGLVTLTCVVWSVPNHFAAMASWYNLFLTTFGMLALMRYLETTRRRWLVAAGLCAGTSVLFKVTGLSFAAAGVLTLLYREQELSFAPRPAQSDPVPESNPPPRPGRPSAYTVIVGLALLGLSAILIALVSQRPTAMNVLHFAVPGLILCGVLIANEFTHHACGNRWRRLTEMGVPFGLGLLLPIAVFAIPYAASSSLDDLYYGVFVLPTRRFANIHLELPPLSSLWTAAPLALLLVAGFRRRSSPIHAGWILAGACGLGLLLSIGNRASVYRATWDSVRPAVPLLALAVFALLGWRGGAAIPADRRAPLFLLAATAALSALVQLPFPGGVYFCYVAPLVILGIHHVVGAQLTRPAPLLALALVYYLLFGVFWNVPGSTFQMSFKYESFEPSAELDLDRARIRVSEPHARLYQSVVEEVQRHSSPGSFIYAAPDIPQIYFLSGRRNPTRSLFDMFAADYRTPDRVRSLLELLQLREVNVVVLSRPHGFSRLPSKFVAAIGQRYPHRVEFEPFVVFWRRPLAASSAHL